LRQFAADYLGPKVLACAAVLIEPELGVKRPDIVAGGKKVP
jgi:hypothetical protein